MRLLVVVTITAMFSAACSSTARPVAPSPTPACSNIRLETDLPPSPPSASVYWQHPVDTTLDEARAAAIAETLGVSGSISSYVGESGIASFTVTGDPSEVTVFSDNPVSFTYSADAHVPLGVAPLATYPPEDLVAYSRAFLSEHQLLPFDNQILPATGSNADGYSVQVQSRLNGIPLFENDPTNPRIWLVFGPDAAVTHLFYDTLLLEDLGPSPIRPAANAWSLLCSGASLDGGLLTTYDAAGRIASAAGRLPIPGEAPASADLSEIAGHVSEVALVYYPFDLRFASVGAYPSDSPVRLVQPVWVFSGTLDGEGTFDILVPALEEGALASVTPPP